MHVNEWDTVMGEVTPRCWGPSEEPWRTSAHVAMSVGMIKLSAIAASKLGRTEGIWGGASATPAVVFFLFSSSATQLNILLNDSSVSCTRSQYQYSLCQSSQQTHEKERIKFVEGLEKRWDLEKTRK